MSAVADIRNLTAAKLLNKTDAKDRVFNSRTAPMMLEHLPAILIYTDKVSATQSSPRSNVVFAQMTLQIDVLVSMVENWGDVCDNTVEAVIDTLMSDADWIAQFNNIEGYDVTYQYLNDMQKPTATASISIYGQLFKPY